MNEPIYAQHLVKGADGYYYYNAPGNWYFTSDTLREIADYVDSINNGEQIDER